MLLNFHVQGEGFPLIILHGLLGAADNWRAMSKRLAAHCQVYTLDLRNHGASPHSPVMSYVAMADDLREFFAGEKIDHAHLLGHSMGGKVAMQFAAAKPEALAKLVIVDIAPRAYEPTDRSLLGALSELELNRCKSYGDAEQALTAAIPDQALRHFLVKNLARGADQSFRWRIGLSEIAAKYDEINHAIVAASPITNPTCFIRAGRSNFIADEDIPAIGGMFTNAHIVTIVDAGPCVHVDDADGFYRAVSEFLLSSES